MSCKICKKTPVFALGKRRRFNPAYLEHMMTTHGIMPEDIRLILGTLEKKGGHEQG